MHWMGRVFKFNDTEKANLRDLIAATGLVILLKIGIKSWTFCPCKLDFWWMTSQNNRTSLLYYIKDWAIGGFKLELQSGNAQFGSKLTIFFSRVTMQFDEWPCKTIGHLFYEHYFKRCASFRSHWWIQTGVTVRKRLIWVKIDNFFNCVTLQFDIWPWKTIGHLFYATSSFVHHFVAIGEFKLELQSRNAQFGSNRTIFRAGWPWNLTDDLEKQ